MEAKRPQEEAPCYLCTAHLETKLPPLELPRTIKGLQALKEAHTISPRTPEMTPLCEVTRATNSVETCRGSPCPSLEAILRHEKTLNLTNPNPYKYIPYMPSFPPVSAEQIRKRVGLGPTRNAGRSEEKKQQQQQQPEKSEQGKSIYRNVSLARTV